jgi:hypothetical protein
MDLFFLMSCVSLDAARTSAPAMLSNRSRQLEDRLSDRLTLKLTPCGLVGTLARFRGGPRPPHLTLPRWRNW